MIAPRMKAIEDPLAQEDDLIDCRVSVSNRAEAFFTWPVLFAFADVAAMMAAFSLAVLLHFRGAAGLGLQTLSAHLGFLVLCSALVPLFGHTQQLYSTRLPQSRTSELMAVLKSVALATLLLSILLRVSGIAPISREVIALTMIAGSAFMVTWRHLRRSWVERAPADGILCENVLLVGTHGSARSLRDYLGQNRQFGYRVVGMLRCDPVSSGDDVEDVIGSVDRLTEIAAEMFVDHVIVCAPQRNVVQQVMNAAHGCSVRVSVIPDLYEGLALGAAIEHVGAFPMIALRERAIPTVSLAVKRLFDLTTSAFGLLLLAPLILIIAAAIKVHSKGPVFYTSNRVGRKGRLFGCHKFRTMVVNAEKLQANLQHLNERDGVLFKIANDPRITGLGRFLRKYSLDEIPQLWNVLKGNMSLVGPRPPVAAEVRQYEIEHLRRLNVTPGITGLWQVRARNDPSFQSYITLDLEYVDRWSLLADFKILFETARVVVTGSGS